MSHSLSIGAVRKSTRAGFVWLTLLAFATCATGCTECKWRWDYQQAEQQARQQGKYLFIFYKWWLSNESNRMHDYIQTDPSVAAVLQDTTNLLLEKDSSPEYANYLSKYGVTTPPALVVVAPDGTYYVQSGFVPKDRFIEFVENAKSGRAVGGKRSSAVSVQKAP